MKRITILHKNPEKAIKQVSRYFSMNPNRKFVKVELVGRLRTLDRKDDYYKKSLTHILKNEK